MSKRRTKKQKLHAAKIKQHLNLDLGQARIETQKNDLVKTENNSETKLINIKIKSIADPKTTQNLNQMLGFDHRLIGNDLLKTLVLVSLMLIFLLGLYYLRTI
jgi:hypothetical protein